MQVIYIYVNFHNWVGFDEEYNNFAYYDFYCYEVWLWNLKIILK